MKKTTQAVLSGALCAAVVTAFSPTTAFATVAATNSDTNVQLGTLSADDEWVDEEDWDDDEDDWEDDYDFVDYEKDISKYKFVQTCNPDNIPDQITFESGQWVIHDEDADYTLDVYKDEDYTLDTQWYKCTSKSGDEKDYEYTPISGTPSEPGTYALKVTGTGEFHGTTYAYFTINDLYDLKNFTVSITSPDYAEDDLVTDEHNTTPEISVTYQDEETGTETILKEGVDYKRVGWYKINTDDNTYEEIPEYVGDQLDVTAQYRYRVEGIGKYHGICNSRLVYWISPYDFLIYYIDMKTQLQLGKDDLKNLAINISRTKTNGEKIILEQGKDFRVNWYGTSVYKDGITWETDKKKPIKTPTKTGVYGISIEGLGAYKGHSYYYDVTVFKPKMTFSLPDLYRGLLSENAKLTNLTLDSKVKGIGYGALSGCKNLSKLTIGKGVKDIDSYAFRGCKKLKTITVKTTKLTKKSVDSDAFKGSSVTTIKVDTGNKKTDKKTVKAYKKLFTKKLCGKKLTVK